MNAKDNIEHIEGVLEDLGSYQTVLKDLANEGCFENVTVMRVRIETILDKLELEPRQECEEKLQLFISALGEAVDNQIQREQRFLKSMEAAVLKVVQMDGEEEVLDDFQRAALDMADATEKLRREYGPHGSHPDWERTAWQLEVGNLDTQLGYWEWVIHQLEADAE